MRVDRCVNGGYSGMALVWMRESCSEKSLSREPRLHEKSNPLFFPFEQLSCPFAQMIQRICCDKILESIDVHVWEVRWQGELVSRFLFL
ncbi:hypothetical protein COLO4_21312 [Corchorus olitorius]|uniref:Uncharacterized protein n=1 Tax=Corchorus olitorius TaxID=93759 RepID=A0A1R3IU87_9ROSI|nr:hypothetical protein COLO4_21312 [Corchorus olitorius]